jgi:ribonuclease HI
VFALEQALRLPPAQRPARLVVFSDSRVVVDQMNGKAAAHSPALRSAKTRLHALCARFQHVSFQHIPRDSNRLADALACEAADGLYRPQVTPPLETIHRAVVDEFFAAWQPPRHLPAG